MTVVFAHIIAASDPLLLGYLIERPSRLFILCQLGFDSLCELLSIELSLFPSVAFRCFKALVGIQQIMSDVRLSAKPRLAVFLIVPLVIFSFLAPDRPSI